jgi:hypothetical protein
MSKVETVRRFGYGSPVGWWAFVDESMRQRHDRTGIGAALCGDRDYMTALTSVVAEMITIELC